MDDINISEIFALLGPSTGEPIWNILIYIIFFLALITLFSLPDKNVVPTVLIATVLLCAVIAKLSMSTSVNPIFRRGEFGMFVINALMFTLPFIAVGTTRKLRLKRSVKSNLPALLTGIFGGVYFFMFWFFIQRGLGLA